MKKTKKQLIDEVLNKDISRTEKLEWIEKIQVRFSRSDFYTFRQYIHPDIKEGWFQKDVAKHFQQFYDDLVAGKRPKLVCEAPPQHGKSIQVIDFIAWVSGKNPELKTIFTSYSERLGKRANKALQRIYKSEKFKKVFPEFKIPESNAESQQHDKLINSELIEHIRSEGSFRNTTVEGKISGESLDLGIIDDPLKGRKDANSTTKRNAIWDWFTDDFFTRFSEEAGFLSILTRWHVDDPIGRLIKNNPDVKVIKYPAIADNGVELMESDPRQQGSEEPLFPEHKSKEFLDERRDLMDESSWASLYQQMPFIKGGKYIKSAWFQIIDESELPFNPEVKYNKLMIDGAFTDKTENDETATLSYFMHQGKMYVFCSDGVRLELNEYLIHFTKNYKHWHGKSGTEVWIEKKASGNAIGSMLQQYQYGNHNVHYVPNQLVNKGKLERVQDSTPFMSAGKIILVKGHWNKPFLDQLEAFPNGAHDDKVDTLTYSIGLEFSDEIEEATISYSS
jgi:predicted phage terminase large subunit-like protein